MKTLHLVMIIILLFSLFPSVEGINDTVYFMKTNSTAKINIEYTFSSVGNWTLYPSVGLYPSNQNSGLPVYSIPVKPSPPFLNVILNKSKYDVTYTIITKNNVSGTYVMFTGFCHDSYPLVVNLNESEINPKFFQNFFTPEGSFGCSPYQPQIQTENVLGYSGIIPKTLSQNFSTWKVSEQPSIVPEFPFAIPIMLLGITLLIVLHKLKSQK